ncbi:unnamed protein product [Closterium sp. NIES-53]
MCGRLRSTFAWWSSWCPCSLILSIIANGYWLPWSHGPPQAFRERNHAGAYAHATFTRTAIQELTETGAAVETTASELTCISPLNVVEQREKCRLILDLRKVNANLIVPKFKYEGLSRVADVARAGDWMFSIDLKSGYHHIDIHPSCWKFLGFGFDRRTYSFRSLPFGLATAPFVFTQLIKQLARRWREQGIRVVPYVDDILFLCQSKAQAQATCHRVILDLKAAGLVINAKKSQLPPSQHLQFLGVELDTATGRFTIGPEQRASLHATIRNLLSASKACRPVPVRQVARITCMLASMGVTLGATARAFSHAMLQVINDAPSWKSNVIIPPPAAEELNFWLEEFDRFNGAPFHVRNSYDAVIHVDASAHSWGATLTTFTGGLEEASATMPEPLRATSSTRREIEGVLWALQTYSSKITHKHVLVRVDNQGVFFILRKGGSRSPDLTTACQGIIRTCMEHGTRLIIEWIPRELNSHADELSKAVDHDDYSLKTPVVPHLRTTLGSPFHRPLCKLPQLSAATLLHENSSSTSHRNLLPKLHNQLINMLTQSRANSTIRTYEPYWAKFRAFCTKLTCSAVSFAHRMTGSKCPSVGPFTTQVRDYAKRHCPRPSRMKEPVSIQQVRDMSADYLQSDNPAEFQKGLIPILMYSGFLRYSDLAGRGTWIPIAATTDPCCPVRCTQRFLQLAGYGPHSEGLLIRVFGHASANKGQAKPPSYTTIRNWCKEAFAKVGLGEQQLGTHSFRKGAATVAANIGVPEKIFKRMGRWRSDTAKEMYVTPHIGHLIKASCDLQDPIHALPPEQHAEALLRNRKPPLPMSQRPQLQ